MVEKLALKKKLLRKSKCVMAIFLAYQNAIFEEIFLDLNISNRSYFPLWNMNISQFFGLTVNFCWNSIHLGSTYVYINFCFPFRVSVSSISHLQSNPCVDVTRCTSNGFKCRKEIEIVERKYCDRTFLKTRVNF